MAAEARQQSLEEPRTIRSRSPARREARPRRRGRRASRARSRGDPRPAASRASARAKSGMRLERLANALAPDRLFVQPRDEGEPRARSRLDRSAARRYPRRAIAAPAAVWQRSISPTRLPVTLPPTDRVSSRLSRVAASIAMCSARLIRRGASSRIPAPFWWHRDRRASPPAAASSARDGVPRPSSVARPNRLLSARSPARLSNPPLPADVRAPGTGESAIVSAGDSRASLGGELSGAAADQLEAAGRDVGRGDRPFLAARARSPPANWPTSD